jgi:hypothetical protein
VTEAFRIVRGNPKFMFAHMKQASCRPPQLAASRRSAWTLDAESCDGGFVRARRHFPSFLHDAREGPPPSRLICASRASVLRACLQFPPRSRTYRSIPPASAEFLEVTGHGRAETEMARACAERRVYRCVLPNGAWPRFQRARVGDDRYVRRGHPGVRDTLSDAHVVEVVANRCALWLGCLHAWQRNESDVPDR